MEHANTQLCDSGLALWGWDTEGGSYFGWIIRNSDRDFFAEAADSLEVDIRQVGSDF